MIVPFIQRFGTIMNFHQKYYQRHQHYKNKAFTFVTSNFKTYNYGSNTRKS